MASHERPATDEPTTGYGTAGGNGYAAKRVGATGGMGGGTDASIGALLGNLFSDTNRLIRDEIRLAKAEFSAKAGQAKSGATTLAIGGALLLLGLIYLLQAIIYALALVMPGWLAALIVGGVIAIVGAVMLKSGQSKLKADNLAPTRTQDNLQRDAQTYKEATR